jgi:hypothetical protein
VNLTTAQLEALERRRMVAIRYERFNAALIVSALFNIHRGEDVSALSPFDFLPGFERDPADEEKEKLRQSVKRSIKLAISGLPKNWTREQIDEQKKRMLGRVKQSGQVEDADELFREIFPED